jgi:hypothetical protein
MTLRRINAGVPDAFNLAWIWWIDTGDETHLMLFFFGDIIARKPQ